MENELAIYQSVIDDVKSIISSGMESAYNATSRAMVLTYWNVGRRIVEQEQNGNQRAEYGTAMMDALAAELTKEYGKSYSKRNLQYFRKFYQCFPDIRSQSDLDAFSQSFASFGRGCQSLVHE